MVRAGMATPSSERANLATASIMDGAQLARTIVARSAEQAAAFTERTGSRPCLATVLVGEDPGSVTYVRMKRNRCEQAGIASRHTPLPAATTTTALIDISAPLSR